MDIENYKKQLFKVNEENFDQLALQLFEYQYKENVVYKAYIDSLKININKLRAAADIPFLPIGFFKTQAVISGSFQAETIFESSGTTSTINSRHYVKDRSLYEQSFIAAFEIFYGSPKDYVIVGLLPSYLERANSSLVYMVVKLMQISGRAENDFFLDDYKSLSHLLQELERKKQKVLLIGVTFALLNFAEAYPQPLKHTIIMETGGMKGRKKEMTRAEIHAILKDRFNLKSIHSEYGMTELMSQAYADKDGLFRCPPWMKIFLRDENDPLSILKKQQQQSGPVNIIDLANIHSCAFIATEDIGRLYPDGKFEILGRRDKSDLRGCSLMTIN